MRSKNIQKDLSLLGDKLINSFLLENKKSLNIIDSFFSEKNILEKSKTKKKKFENHYRNILVEQLNKQYSNFKVSENTSKNINSLENSNSLELTPFQYFNHNLRTRTGDFALGSFDYNHVFKNKTVVKTSFLMEYTLLGGPTTNQNISSSDPLEIYQDEYNTNDNPLLGTRINVDYSNIETNLGNLELGYQFRKLNHKGDFTYERKNPISEIFELVSEFSSEVNLKRTIHSTYGMLVGSKSKWNYNFGIRVEQMNDHLKNHTTHND